MRVKRQALQKYIRWQGYLVTTKDDSNLLLTHLICELIENDYYIRNIPFLRN